MSMFLWCTQHSTLTPPGLRSVSRVRLQPPAGVSPGHGWSGVSLNSTSFVLASGECCSVVKNACKFFGCVFMLETFYSHFMKPICEILVPFILHFTALVVLPGLLRLFTAHVSSTQGKRNNFKTYYPSKTK